MKVIFITDLHGNKWKYERLFKVAKSTKANLVINGGDMLPTEGDLFKQGEFIITYLESHFSQFESAGIYYLCCLGNDDLRIFDELFEKTCKKFSFVIPLAQQKFEIDNYEFIGFNLIVDYPFRLKDRCRQDTHGSMFRKQHGTGLLSSQDGWQEIDDWFSYVNSLPTIADELNNLVIPNNMVNCVYAIHMPPYRLGLDKCNNGRNVGSKAVYDFLMKNQPKFALHGHIHESPEVSGHWYAKLGNTICVQPGQLDKFTYVIIDLSTMKINRINL